MHRERAVEQMLRAQADEAGWESISLYVAELVRAAEWED